MKRFLQFFCAVLILLSLIGCKSSEPVTEQPHVVILHDTVFNNIVRTDSVTIRDSVYVEGEKVYRYRNVYHTRELHDTLYIVRTDTVPVIRTYTKYVERQETWCSKTLKGIGALCLIAVLMWIMFLYLKRRL